MKTLPRFPTVLARKFPFAVMVFLACGLVASAGVAWGLPCRQLPEISTARTMLAALPPAEQALREAAVESTLARLPGAGETFLSALMSWEYLTGGWSDPGLAGQPYPPAEGNVYNNRRYGYMSSMPTTVSVGAVGFRTLGLLFTSPLILDLDHSGAPDVAGGGWEPHAGMDLNGLRALFDIDGDGFPELTEWAGPADGLLVAPQDPGAVEVGGDGALIWTGPLSGRDLLGSAGGWADGFAKLAHLFDADHDGVVSGPELDGLFLWQDLSQDAAVQPGELFRPQDLLITALRLPDAASCTGSYDSMSGPFAMWDWWPSYLQGYRVWTPGPPAPPSSVPLVEVALPDLAQPGSPLPIGPDGVIGATALAAAGLDFQTVRLIGLSPEGSWLVLQDRMSSLASVADGFVRRLWILPVTNAAGSLIPRIVPVPAADILQFVFADDGTAFLVTDNGCALMKLDLATGALTRLYASSDAAAALRFGQHAFSGPAGVSFSGWFHDAELASHHQSIVSFAELSGAPSLIEAADHDLVVAGVEHLGVVACEIPVTPQLYHFVVRTASGGSLLVVSRAGVVTVADDNVQPGGLAASGERVLYFRQVAGQVVPEVRVFDALTGEVRILGAGDYCYPYLTANGTMACVASIDWQAMTLTMWRAAVVPGAVFQPVLTGAGIGAVRVSEDGRRLVCLGPDGLHLSTLVAAAAGAEAVPFARLDQNQPNPFNPRTTVSFTLPAAGHAVVAIYDAKGRMVARLVDESLPAGAQTVDWNGQDAFGVPMPSGTYICRLTTPWGVETRKMSMLR